MTETAASPALDLTCRALAHVLDLDPSHLRADTPLGDVGADSVALIVFGDVAIDMAAKDLGAKILIDDDRLRTADTVADLAGALWVRQPWVAEVDEVTEVIDANEVDE